MILRNIHRVGTKIRWKAPKGLDQEIQAYTGVIQSYTTVLYYVTQDNGDYDMYLDPCYVVHTPDGETVQCLIENQTIRVLEG